VLVIVDLRNDAEGAMLVNVGRGKHLVFEDLIRAIDSGQLSYAALDALWPEPLLPDSPLWLHPKVTVMPHVARRSLLSWWPKSPRTSEASGPAAGCCRQSTKQWGIDRLGSSTRSPKASSRSR
jgi:hypothetical protein